MKLLLIDTCGAVGTLALAETTPGSASAAILGTSTLPGRTASERLVPAIEALASDCAASLNSLDAIAVVHGPGSFTGVRIGLSAAKGLCEALATPLIAISRLAVMAEMASSSSSAIGPIHAFLDAGRGEFYYGEYVEGICLREVLITLDAARAAVTYGQTAVVCEAKVASALQSFAPTTLPEPTAVDALTLALRSIDGARFDDIATIDANYVRRTDAEIFAKPKPASR